MVYRFIAAAALRRRDFVASRPYAYAVAVAVAVGDLLGEERSTSSKVCRRLTIIPRAISWLHRRITPQQAHRVQLTQQPPAQKGRDLA